MESHATDLGSWYFRVNSSNSACSADEKGPVLFRFTLVRLIFQVERSKTYSKPPI
jgi:hypothetical protein